jgi:nitrous oxide reductase accessory protein NosL
MIDPLVVFFVTGSYEYGPMGSELIPFKTEKDAARSQRKAFLKFN